LLSVNTNVAALHAQAGLRVANTLVESVSAGMSQGPGVTFDDATHMLGVAQAISNVQMGAALAQTADSALGDITSLAQRIRGIAVQAASGTTGAEDRATLQSEVDGLTAQISSALGTKFNGLSLFDTSAATASSGASGSNLTIQAGANVGDTIALSMPNLSLGRALADPGGIIGFKVNASDASNTDNGASNATSTIRNVDSFMKLVDQARSAVGATESRLDYSENSMSNAAVIIGSELSDLDSLSFSSDTTTLAKSRILSDSSTALLAQANASQNYVLKLLDVGS